jgi:hypothetical protein
VYFVAIYCKKGSFDAVFFSQSGSFVAVFCCRLRQVGHNILVGLSTTVVTQWPQING